eukprot:4210324-Pyramimonas_sp.AAC.1
MGAAAEDAAVASGAAVGEGPEQRLSFARGRRLARAHGHGASAGSRLERVQGCGGVHGPGRRRWR